jgi:hypothetical protein
LIFSPANDLTVFTTDRGEIELFSPRTDTRFWCEGSSTAMWIVLRQHGGRIHDATQALSEAWEEDLTEVSVEMWAWAHNLWAMGLLTTELTPC